MNTIDNITLEKIYSIIRRETLRDVKMLFEKVQEELDRNINKYHFDGYGSKLRYILEKNNIFLPTKYKDDNPIIENILNTQIYNYSDIGNHFFMDKSLKKYMYNNTNRFDYPDAYEFSNILRNEDYLIGDIMNKEEKEFLKITHIGKKKLEYILRYKEEMNKVFSRIRLFYNNPQIREYMDDRSEKYNEIQKIINERKNGK